MNYEIERMLKHTPYNSYDDLFSAVFNGKAFIKLSNSACRQIAQTQKPVFANFGVHYGFIPSAIMTIAFAILSNNYLLLFLLLAECIFSFVVYFFDNLKVKTGLIAGIIVFCDLFLIRLPLPVLILSLSWLFNCWTIKWWQKKIYKTSIKILQYNQDAFEWAYNSHNLLIEDCYANVYDKFRQNESETKSYERFLKVIEVGSGTDNIDDAISMFSTFYIDNGVDIPRELYLEIAHLPMLKKIDNLLKILELGTGVIGIDNITAELIDFYKANGIEFPADI